MKKITHPTDSGTGNKAFNYRCGPTAEHKGVADGGKDLSANAKNVIGKHDGEMKSPGPAARKH